MKKCLFFVVGLILVCHTAMADASDYGVSFGYGEANSNIEAYRVGVKKDFSAKWFESSVGYVSGYFELSYNYWKHHNEDINAVAFSPVVAYYFADASSRIRPYIEGGVGLAYIDDYDIANRNLSSNFQFEDRIGIGARIGLFDLNFRYMHYSNASIKGSNDGIDLFMFATTIQF